MQIIVSGGFIVLNFGYSLRVWIFSPVIIYAPIYEVSVCYTEGYYMKIVARSIERQNRCQFFVKTELNNAHT